METHLEPWADQLATHGLRVRRVLGAGMEGVVLALDGGRVAKVWHTRSGAELAVVRAFYDALAEADLPLQTPHIHDVIELDGRWASVEPHLTGEPMGTPSVAPLPPLDARAVDAVVDVLAALSEVAPRPGLSGLPILPGEEPFGARGFGAELAALVERRVGRFAVVLAAAVPDLEACVTAVTTGLRALDPLPSRLVHGDLVAPNLLVDERGRPSAVLDFGFLTCLGDPAFEAAVTASVFDMYGPHARDNEASLERAILGRFGYDVGRLGLYRAAYALCTSNCFDEEGRDGHFAWCVAMLRRPDVRAALG